MLAHASGSLIERALDKDGSALPLYPTRKALKAVVKYNGISTVQRTNFIQNLSATGGGSSTIFLSPQAGLLNTVLAIKLPDEVAGAYNTAALPQSWGWSAVNSIQLRIGDSSLFEFSGRQLFLQMIRTAGSQSESEDLCKLAGNALFKTATNNPFSDEQNLWAYMPISLPWCGAESRNMPMPLDTSMLNSNIQIVVNLKSPSEVIKFFNDTAYPVGSIPNSWDEAFIQVKQVIPLSGEHKMTREAEPLTLPVTFVQQENSTSVSNVTAEQNKAITISGFRSGSVQEVDFWFLKQGVDLKLNPFDYTLPYDISLEYMGEKLAEYRGFSSQLWTTLYSGRPCRIVQPRLSQIPGPVVPTIAPFFQAEDSVVSWVQVPFEGLYMDLEAENPISNSGIAIQNGILNLSVKFVEAGDYTCFYTADLQAGIAFRDGSCDYVF
jgi:hypothetical protein